MIRNGCNFSEDKGTTKMNSSQQPSALYCLYRNMNLVCTEICVQTDLSPSELIRNKNTNERRPWILLFLTYFVLLYLLSFFFLMNKSKPTLHLWMEAWILDKEINLFLDKSLFCFPNGLLHLLYLQLSTPAFPSHFFCFGDGAIFHS